MKESTLGELVRGAIRPIEQEIKQSRFRNDSDRLFINLVYTSNFIMHRMSVLLKANGALTLQQYNILRILRGQKGAPLPMHEVKSRMLDRNSDVSRIIDRMVRKNLITRTTCTDDRRQVDLLLAPRGAQLLAAIEPDVQKVMQPLELVLPGEQQRLFSDALDRMRAIMPALPAEGAQPGPAAKPARKGAPGAKPGRRPRASAGVAG